MSVIDLVKNVVIGSPLKTWEAWPLDSTAPVQDDGTSSLCIMGVVICRF